MVSLLLALLVWEILTPSAGAQTCITPNCVFAKTPPECANRAAPRTPIVLMGNGASLVFVPPNPKIEPGDCIQWKGATVTHSSSGSLCPESAFCDNPAPPTCQWETTNVSTGSLATCSYPTALFPENSGTGYFCRLHATATTGTMRGTLRVTTPIQLTVGKDVGTNAVLLSWIGGGVAGDVSYKVARQVGGDPKFPAASTTTVNPDGGTLGTTFTDVGVLTNPVARYYLVRNKQTNE